MALTSCKECGHQISDRAAACPHCGAKPPKRASIVAWVVALIFGAAIFKVTLNTHTTPPPTASPAATQQAPYPRRQATAWCRHFVRQRLHDPDSATFAHSSEAEVRISGNRALVVREVRAKNAVGAIRLSEFTCLLELNGDNTRAFLVSDGGASTPAAQAVAEQWLAGK